MTHQVGDFGSGAPKSLIGHGPNQHDMHAEDQNEACPPQRLAGAFGPEGQIPPADNSQHRTSLSWRYRHRGCLEEGCQNYCEVDIQVLAYLQRMIAKDMTST